MARNLSSLKSKQNEKRLNCESLSSGKLVVLWHGMAMIIWTIAFMVPLQSFFTCETNHVARYGRGSGTVLKMPSHDLNFLSEICDGQEAVKLFEPK